jgi:hypothetical protein
MSYTILTLLALFIFIAYYYGKSIKNASGIGKTNESTETDSFGPIIATIDFTVKAIGDELIDFEDGIIRWISIGVAQKTLTKKSLEFNSNVNLKFHL